MIAETFNRILEEQLNRSREVLGVKAGEYATDDRLHNFKVAARLQGITPLEALAGMMAKHTVSVYDLCRSKDPVNPDVFDEKVTDHINYLILAKALFEEAAPVDDTPKSEIKADVTDTNFKNYFVTGSGEQLHNITDV